MFKAKIINSAGVMQCLVDDTFYTISKNRPNYCQILKAFKDNDSVKFVTLVNQDHLNEVDDKYPEVRKNSVLLKRMNQLSEEGHDIKYFQLFMNNIMQNPSYRSVEELYKFLDREGLPITEDGCFLAYKVVNSDYYSKTGGKLTLVQGKANEFGKILNSIGETVECLRNEVDDNCDRTCSQGLHVGALRYAGPNGTFYTDGDRVVVVKVNPRDAVSVPTNANSEKLRVCKYEVVGEYIPYDTSMAKVVNNKYVPKEVEHESYFNVEDVLEGDTISFVYRDKKRHVIVENIDTDYLEGTLINPEECVGEYRRFIKDNMAKVDVLSIQ